MNDTVAAIRQVEQKEGSESHIIAVQGTRAWSRYLDYYVKNPIEAGNGENVAYETHVYNATSDFDELFIDPAQTLPVIIGEYGHHTYMTLEDCENLMVEARTLEIPHLAWTFHMRCPPNLLVDYSEGGCGVGMKLDPTEWGSVIIKHLGIDW